MRIVKEPEERKSEILTEAEKLFAAKGYEKTSVNDILLAVNIAKGTFYYHFKSKEEVLDALIEMRIKTGVTQAEKIIASPLPPVQKILAIIMAQKPQDKTQKDFNSVLHEKDNSKMHEKSIVQSVIHLSPYLAKVIKEGIEAGIFFTLYPLESVEIVLTSAMILFDDDFFKWSKKEKKIKIKAFLTVIERVFGAKAGSFSEFTKAFS